MTAPGVMVIDGEIVSSCCRAEVEVKREVGDTVVYWPENLLDDEEEINVADGKPFPPVLQVRYGKVYEGHDNGGYEVTCQGCFRDIEIEVEEL